MFKVAMADDDGMGFFGKEQPEIALLKETLRAQQNLLHKLYRELEAERESASTASNEALNMILRLQGEKAEVKMEAEQYKRLVEEKMCHAEESLSVFEELMYQKDMEIASLDYQIEAYRYKLISMGCTDPEIIEKFPENEDDTSSQNLETPMRRICVTPKKFKLLNPKKGLNERDGLTSPSNILEEREEKEWSDQGSDSEMFTAYSPRTPMSDINSYFEQIRRLDERVKEIAGVHLQGARSSPLPLSHLGSGNSSDPMKLVSTDETEHAKSRGNSSDNDSTDTPGVYDVFEVPQVDHHETSHEKTVAFSADDLIKRLDSIPDDALKPEDKIGIKWLNNFLVSAGVKKMSGPRETALDCNKAIPSPTPRVVDACPQNSIQQIRTSEIIEVGSHSSRDESGDKGEELSLLSEIKEQLNSIQSAILNLKTNHSVPKEQQAVVTYMETTLMEEMVHFWL